MFENQEQTAMAGGALGQEPDKWGRISKEPRLGPQKPLTAFGESGARGFTACVDQLYVKKSIPQLTNRWKANRGNAICTGYW